MPRAQPLVNVVPVFILLVASILAVALFSLPWATTAGQFRGQTGMKLPDLTVADVTWTQLTDRNIRVTATIANNGAATAGGFNVRFWDVSENRQISITTLPGLSPGQSTTTSVIHNEPHSTCTVRVSVDWGNLVAETNETNNDRIVTLTLE